MVEVACGYAGDLGHLTVVAEEEEIACFGLLDELVLCHGLVLGEVVLDGNFEFLFCGFGSLYLKLEFVHPPRTRGRIPCCLEIESDIVAKLNHEFCRTSLNYCTVVNIEVQLPVGLGGIEQGKIHLSKIFVLYPAPVDLFHAVAVFTNFCAFVLVNLGVFFAVPFELSIMKCGIFLEVAVDYAVSSAFFELPAEVLYLRSHR